MDIEELKKALENADNLNISETNYSEIKNKKNNVLQQIGLTRDELKNFHKKLQDYIYV